MSFRERPGYREWRDAVYRLFGQQCILCRHGGNIHAHHVRPVNTNPELAFEPKNGVPLCGNCHAEVKSNELAYVDEFERRQRVALASTDEDKIDALRSIARICMENERYEDARGYLREALRIDDVNVDVIADVAHCYHMDDNAGEAIQTAKQGLKLDPHNKCCQRVYAY